MYIHCASIVLLHSCIDFLLLFWSVLWFIQTKKSLDDLICTLNLVSKIKHLLVIWVENGWHQKFVNSTSNLQVKISYSVSAHSPWPSLGNKGFTQPLLHVHTIAKLLTNALAHCAYAKLTWCKKAGDLNPRRTWRTSRCIFIYTDPSKFKNTAMVRNF